VTLHYIGATGPTSRRSHGTRSASTRYRSEGHPRQRCIEEHSPGIARAWRREISLVTLGHQVTSGIGWLHKLFAEHAPGTPTTMTIRHRNNLETPAIISAR
jgi:hypothetical protein